MLIRAATLSMTAVLVLPGPSRLHEAQGEAGESSTWSHITRPVCQHRGLFTVAEATPLINSPGLLLPAAVTVTEFTKANHDTLRSPDVSAGDLPSEAADGRSKPLRSI